MKKSIFILAAVALLAMVSCNNKAKENQNQESAATVALSVDDILAKGDSLVGKTVTVEGVCTHICKHGGKKLFMMGTDDTKMLRAEACELGSFPAEVVNSLVSVTGTLEEDRIDEATIQRMEEQYKNQSGEKHGDGEAGCESEKKERLFFLACGLGEKRKLPDKPTSIHSKVAYGTSENALPKPKKPVKTIS